VLSDNTSPKENRVAVGLNSNVRVSGQVLHVQTEDLGRNRSAIVTHVFSSTGQVTRVVRFDYKKHVDHPSLQSILPRAMYSQHSAVIRQLHVEAGDVPESQTDVTPPPFLITDSEPSSSSSSSSSSSEIAIPPLECLHQKVGSPTESVGDLTV
jgi:hypothetical protein